MIYLKRHWSILLVLVWFLGPGVKMRTMADTPPQRSTAAEALSRLLPLPEDVPRTIKNPYYAKPAWKLWALDPSPVTIDKPHFKGTFQLPTVRRMYPVLNFKKGSGELTLLPLDKKSLLSGFWDDCYMSLDFHHTRMGHFKNQFIDGGKMQTARDVQTLLELGVNFTSQSYSDRGRAIVDDTFNNLNTERHFFFANCIRATPGHASYEDVEVDKVTDFYDGLFAHSFHSLGQSGSEIHAIYKLMAAGACMPRSTKNLLKKHGAYAIALLTIFKAALPYADAQGRTLPFEHHLRHRPVYSSHGTPSHGHYCTANTHYHGYDEQRHLQGMMDMAKNLESAPPVAIAKLLSFMVKKNGQTISDPASLAKKVKCLSLTNMRFWGQKDETLEVRISLNQSYDLQNKKLHFKCLALYPNQKNVSVSQEASGIYLIRVRYDPKLPKGRIAVICTAYNDLAVPSNPVFINFYWPSENEADDYFPMRGLPKDTLLKIKKLGLKRLPATANLRPIVDVGFTGDALRCIPGQKVSIDFKAHDPEGYPVTVFRRTGQIGTIEQNRFTAGIPSTDQDKVYRVHLVFSDGTGGYTGKQIKLLVANQKDSLPEDWAITVMGQVQNAVHVSYDDNTFTFGKQLLDQQHSPMEGTFVFKPVPKTVDLICRIPKTNTASDIALMITNTLDDSSRRSGIGYFQGKLSAVMKSSERGRPYQWDTNRSDKPEYFRLTSRDDFVASYISKDNKTWEQVMAHRAKFFKQCYAGLIYRGNPWDTGTCQWLPAPGSGLPILTAGNKVPDKQDRYNGPLEITVTSPYQDRILRYTLDGSEPTARSQVYQGPIKLTRAGRHEIRAKAFQGELTGGTAFAVYHLNPDTDKPENIKGLEN